MLIVSATQFKTFNRNRNAKRAGLGVRKQMIAPAASLPLIEDGVARCASRSRPTASTANRIASPSPAGTCGITSATPSCCGHTMRRACRSVARLTSALDDGALKASVEFIPEDTARGRRVRRHRVSPCKAGFHRRDLGRLPPDEVGLHDRQRTRRRRLVSRDRLRGTRAGRAVDRHRARQPGSADRCARSR